MTDCLLKCGNSAKNHELTRNVDLFLVHPSFPVDIRHNAKIFREKLKIWAQGKIG